MGKEYKILIDDLEIDVFIQSIGAAIIKEVAEIKYSFYTIVYKTRNHLILLSIKTTNYFNSIWFLMKSRFKDYNSSCQL